MADDDRGPDLLAELRALTKAHADAWILLGRCDMAFELIEAGRSVTAARKTAREMRAAIKKANEHGR